MPFQLSNRQLEQLEEHADKAVVVRHPRTKRKFVVISEAAYERARPILEYVSAQVDLEQADTPATEVWTEEKNTRRIALIDKKHDHKLTAAERQELEDLQQQAYRHRERVAPVRNEVLELLLEALEGRSKREHSPA